MLFTLEFVSTLVGIGVLPAAYADSTPAPCATGKTTASEGGGEAEWTKCTKDGYTQIKGRVIDTAVDNKCAQAVIDFSNDVRHQSGLACDLSAPIDFDYRELADGADIEVLVRKR
ncbi:MAG: hypothetical protein ACRER3_19760 [Pseudomonas fluorescens]